MLFVCDFPVHPFANFLAGIVGVGDVARGSMPRRNSFEQLRHATSRAHA